MGRWCNLSCRLLILTFLASTSCFCCTHCLWRCLNLSGLFSLGMALYGTVNVLWLKEADAKPNLFWLGVAHAKKF